MRIFASHTLPVIIAVFILFVVSLITSLNLVGFQILVGGEQGRENTLQTATLNYGTIAGLVIVLVALITTVAYFGHAGKAAKRRRRR